MYPNLVLISPFCGVPPPSYSPDCALNLSHSASCDPLLSTAVTKPKLVFRFSCLELWHRTRTDKNRKVCPMTGKFVRRHAAGRGRLSIPFLTHTATRFGWSVPRRGSFYFSSRHRDAWEASKQRSSNAKSNCRERGSGPAKVLCVRKLTSTAARRRPKLNRSPAICFIQHLTENMLLPRRVPYGRQREGRTFHVA